MLDVFCLSLALSLFLDVVAAAAAVARSVLVLVLVLVVQNVIVGMGFDPLISNVSFRIAASSVAPAHMRTLILTRSRGF